MLIMKNLVRVFNMNSLSHTLFVIGIVLVIFGDSSDSIKTYLAILLMFGSLIVSLYLHIKAKDKQSKTKRNIFG
jgi:O-antigen/teichoic acid export membrane protein